MKCPVACEASVVLDGILHSSPQFVFAVTFRFLLQLCNGGHVSVPAVPSACSCSDSHQTPFVARRFGLLPDEFHGGGGLQVRWEAEFFPVVSDDDSDLCSARFADGPADVDVLPDGHGQQDGGDFQACHHPASKCGIVLCQAVAEADFFAFNSAARFSPQTLNYLLPCE